MLTNGFTCLPEYLKVFAFPATATAFVPFAAKVTETSSAFAGVISNVADAVVPSSYSLPLVGTTITVAVPALMLSLYFKV